MLYKFLFCILISSLSLSVFASAKDVKMLQIINAEISLIQKNKFRDDQLEYRYIELYSRKLKIFRKAENEKYLKESIVKGNKIDKKKYFGKSEKVYRQIVGYSAGVLKKRKGKHQYSQEIIYLLGHLDTIYNKSKLAYTLYSKILKGKKSKVYYKAAAALGELNYNSKNFQKAHEFYSIAILNTKDKLLSKYLYLLSWSELKLEKTAAAISHLEKSINLSRSGYFDVSTEALATIAYFYFSNDQIDEAISFLKKKSPGKADEFLKLTDYAFENSKLSYIPRLNREIKQIARITNNQDYLTKSMLIDMKYYRQTKDYKRHLGVSRTVKDKILSSKGYKTLREDVIAEIREFLTLIQLKRFYSGKKSQFKNLPEVKLNIAYYEVLSAIDAENKFEYAFVEGELHYRLEDYNKASKLYMSAARLIETKKIKTEIYKKSLDSLAATYKMNKSEVVFNFIFGRFLKKFPKSDTTKKLLPLKFSQALKKKKYKTAEVVVIKYYKSFPAEKVIAQGMLATLVDFYIDQKRLGKIKAWSRKLDSGYLGLSDGYKMKVRGTIGQLELNKANTAVSKSPRKAEQLYVKLYRNPGLSSDIRGRASLAIANMKLNKFDIVGTHNWTMKSLAVFSAEENIKFSTQYYALAEKIALHQDVKGAKKIYNKFLSQNCMAEFNNKDSYLNKYLHYSILLKNKNIKKTVSFVEKCSGTIKSDKWRELAVYHIFEYDLYKVYNSEFRSLVRNYDFFKKTYKKISEVYWKTGNGALLTSMRKMSKSLNYRLLSNTDKLELSIIKDIQKYEREITRYEHLSLVKKKTVSERKVNNDINLVLSELTKLDSLGQSIIKKGHPEASIKVTRLIGKAYESAVRKLKNYSFNGLPVEAQKAYKEQVTAMLSGLSDKAFSFTQKSRKAVVSNSIFSQTSLADTPIMLKDEQRHNYRYPASVMTVMEVK